MIEVIPAPQTKQGNSGSDAGTSAGKVELLVAATDFFANRLLTRKQQRQLTFLIEFTAYPVRGPINLEMMAGKLGLFGFRPPRLFEMTVSSAAGMRAALEAVAVEMVYITQLMSRRLQIFAKKRKIDGQREIALKSRWLGSRAVFIDTVPKAERAWVAEAEMIAQQLVGEFLAWSSGRIQTVPRQRPKGNKIGLYRVRPARIVMPASSQVWVDQQGWGDQIDDAAWSPAAEDAPALRASRVDPVTANGSDPVLQLAQFAALHSQAPNHPAPNHPARDQATASNDDMVEHGRQLLPAQPPAAAIVPVDPPQTAEFVIFVDVPALGMARRLNSGAFHGKLNDLLERGLIARESARAAMRLADDRYRRKP